jgi:hypothetical protein
VRLDIEWNLGKSTPVLKMVDKLAKNAARSPSRRQMSVTAQERYLDTEPQNEVRQLYFRLTNRN